MDLKKMYERLEYARQHLDHVSSPEFAKETRKLMREALFEGQAAVNELDRLYLVAHAVVMQFENIDDQLWPTRGMRVAIERLRETLFCVEAYDEAICNDQVASV